ncbi:MAG TPA: adenylate/guanylate cyclase domain-containing protein, partial [Candidatus Dormibacteraeota bacterium]|nr:adenylate/guanylate cyclase domain-containing protein [Candidatus Dormibacteraeota bacterium]
AADELAQLFPQLGRATPATGDAAQAKMRLFESILMLLGDAASHRALLLILEDLQWADPATRELLDYATRRLRSTNVVIVATYRSDEMHRKHALLPTIQGWRRSGQVETIDLQPLSAAQVAEMVCAIFEEKEITNEFRDFIHERCEGNPFVLEEMLRDAVDRGEMFRTDTGWDRKTLAEFRIPPTVRDTILQRLERLSPEHSSVLSAASVMGRSFDIAALARVASVDKSVALAALEASVSAQLVELEDRGSGRYRFRHALTQEAIYEDLVVPRRQQLHGRAADVLAADPTHRPVDVANNLLRAARYDEAVAMCVAAADEASERYAYRDAAELLERAAPHVKDRVERARMLCRAGQCYWDNTESAQAKRLLESGIPDLEEAGVEEAAGYRLLLGRSLWELRRSDLAREQFEKVRAMLEPRGPSESLALAYMRLGSLAAWNGDYNHGFAETERAVQIAEAAGADLVRTWSLNFLGSAEISLGRIDAGFAHIEESYQRSLTRGYRFQIGNAVYNASWEASHLGLGDVVSRWAERVGTGWVSASAPWPEYINGLVALQRGQVPDAIAHARNSLQRSRDVGHQTMLWRSLILLAHSLAEHMDPDAAVEVLPDRSTRVDTQDSIYDTAARIRVRLAQGDPAAALVEAKTFPPSAGYMVGPIDAVAEVVDDPAWLRAFIEASPLQGEARHSPRLAIAEGRLALLEGRLDDAVEALGRGVDGLSNGGLLLDAWHGGRWLAVAESRRGEHDAARRRLSSIAAEAESHGALLAAQLARATGADLGLDVTEAHRQGDGPATARLATGERMVSILFADVRGYTQLSGEVAPADLAERIATLQRWAKQEVERRHGVVDKFAGDAIMATFNVTGQSVDHAVQALRSALAIIDKASLAGLPVGAGVAVGPAVVGNLAESANLSVLGEVTNLASRLQAQAETGQVLLAEEVYRRSRDWLDAQRIAAEPVTLQLKGFAKPVVAYRVRSEVVVAAPA